MSEFAPLPSIYVRPPLLTVTEVAIALEVSASTVRRIIKDGQLAVVRIGRLIRIDPDELERYERDVERFSMTGAFCAFDVPGVAEILQVPPATVLRLVRVRFLGAFGVGDRADIMFDELERFVAKNTQRLL